MMKAQKSGRVINITSINGMRGKFGQSNYAAAKAGIIGLTKSMARELGRSQVTVNAVAPGLIETDMVEQAPVDVIKQMIPMARMGQPEEVAEPVIWLASDRSAYPSG